MQALAVPAKHGLAWIVGGYRLFAKGPPVLVLLIFGYLTVLGVSNILPILGPLAVVVVTPAFLVGLMTACRALEQGEAAELKGLFSGIGANFPVLLRLGLAFLTATVAILAITALIDDGNLMRMGVPEPGSAEDFLADDRLVLALNVASMLFFPVLIVFLFASMLAAWHGVEALKSLFFSCFAGLRNIRAFLVYALVLFALNSFLPAVIFVLATAIFGKSGAVTAIIVLLPLSFVLLAAMLASVYVSYRDIFRDD